MKFTSVVPLLAVLATSSAFVPTQPRAFRPVVYMAEDEEAAPAAPAPAPAAPAAPASEPAGALVPIKEETVEFTAGIVGGAAGFVLGGPVLGFIAAAAANYVARNPETGEVSNVISAVSKTSIEVFNYLGRLDSKYEVLNKAKGSLESALDKLKSQGSVDKEAVAKVEGALDATKGKINEINDEYDLVGASTTALGVIGDLVEKAVKKAGEVNEEYKLTDKAITALSGAVDKAKETASKAK